MTEDTAVELRRDVREPSQDLVVPNFADRAAEVSARTITYLTGATIVALLVSWPLDFLVLDRQSNAFRSFLTVRPFVVGAACLGYALLKRAPWARIATPWVLLTMLTAAGLSAGLSLARYPNALLGQFSTVVGYLMPFVTVALVIPLRARVIVNVALTTGVSVVYFIPNPHILEMDTTLPLMILVYVAGGVSVAVGHIIYGLLRANFEQQQELESRRRRVERINDRMVAELADRSARVGELVRALDDSVEAERTHLARELHDELGQLFGALRIELAVAEERVEQPKQMRETLARLDELCGLAAAALHDVVRGLRPRAVEELGLQTAIKTTVEGFAARAGLRCRISMLESPLGLGPQTAQQVYRIVQECLTNVLRHADAATVFVEVARDDSGSVAISVRDDGVGFDYSAALESGRHGLKGIEERARSIGAELSIESGPGDGTLVRVLTPSTN